MKGFENIRSNFAAVRALTYSLGRAKGCRAGSRLREMGAVEVEEEGRFASRERWRTLII